MKTPTIAFVQQPYQLFANKKENGEHKKKEQASEEKRAKKEAFLKKALLDAQRNFADAYNGMQNVSDPDLIDSYIYALNAADLRCKVLLRDIKNIETSKS